MFYAVSKILWFIFEPSNFLILLALIGLALTLSKRRRTAGLRLTAVAVILLAIAGISPLGNILLEPLEDRFPVWTPAQGPPDGIIVLGGVINPGTSVGRGRPQLNESAERITAAVELAQRYPSARVVFSGGNGDLLDQNEPGLKEADQALILLQQLGVPRARITIERRSRNTWENAVFTKALIMPQPGQHWLLITSAAHMPRAVGCFRKAGFPVEPYPVDWRTYGPTGKYYGWFESASDGLKRVDHATHEWVGLAAYWLTGRSSALFPAPLNPVSPAAAGQADTRP